MTNISNILPHLIKIILSEVILWLISRSQNITQAPFFMAWSTKSAPWELIPERVKKTEFFLTNLESIYIEEISGFDLIILVLGILIEILVIISSNFMIIKPC